MFLPAGLVAQTFLIPGPPGNQSLNPVGIRSVSMPVPGFLVWEVRFLEILGSPDFIFCPQLLADPAVAATVRVWPIPFPPVNPTDTVRIAVVGPDLVTVLPDAGFAGGVMFGLFRKPPV